MFSRARLVLTIFVSFIILQDSSCLQRKNLGRSLTNVRDGELSFPQLAAKYGYEVEEHTVVTEDGYILTNFRMRAKKCEGKMPPVLVMHGLLMSSDIYLDAGPKAGLAYLLANACYDVWTGNYRGNYYSRAHTTLNPDKDHDYWNFSYDQMGYYDVPAIIDYILDKTSYKSLGYIGYSQGAAGGYIMCSERPEYCHKMNVFINLAPSTRHMHSKSRLSRLLSVTMMKHERKFARAGIYEVLGKPEKIPDFISMFCNLNIGEPLCRIFLILMDSYHAGSLPRTTVKTLFGHFSAGTSVHNMAHYGQAMSSNDFKKFDYSASNIKVYGSHVAPSYNLGATTAPVVVIYGEHDGMADILDTRWLLTKLTNLVEAYLVPDRKWNHLDFAYSRHVPKMVFPKINHYLRQYSESNVDGNTDGDSVVTSSDINNDDSNTTGDSDVTSNIDDINQTGDDKATDDGDEKGDVNSSVDENNTDDGYNTDANNDTNDGANTDASNDTNDDVNTGDSNDTNDGANTGDSDDSNDAVNTADNDNVDNDNNTDYSNTKNDGEEEQSVNDELKKIINDY